MFIELYFAMTSVWLGFFYYLFFFVLAVGILTIVINVEISILCTYVQLCAEDYDCEARGGGSDCPPASRAIELPGGGARSQLDRQACPGRASGRARSPASPPAARGRRSPGRPPPRP
jgi:hypothetical protein